MIIFHIRIALKTDTVLLPKKFYKMTTDIFRLVLAMFYNSANVFLRYICISAPWQVKLDKMGSEMSLKHLFSQQILLFWTQCSRMCAPGTIRR